MHKHVTTTDTFNTEILHLWSEISYERNVNSLDHFLSLPLWHNSLTRIDNKPVFYQSWYSKGIRNVADLLKDRNVFLSFHELKHRFDVKAIFLTLLGLQSSLQLLREKCQGNQCAGVCESFLERLFKTKKANKVVYNYKKLVSMKQVKPTQSQEKWIADCKLQRDDLIDWTAVYLSRFKCTKVTKLIIFQFKLLHRRLATNSFLKKIGRIKETENFLQIWSGKFNPSFLVLQSDFAILARI